MQLDTTAAAIFAGLSIVGSAGMGLVSGAITYGIMREKISRIETDLVRLRDLQGQHVPYKHFEDILNPMRETLQNVQRDIRTILYKLGNKSKDTEDS